MGVNFAPGHSKLTLKGSLESILLPYDSLALCYELGVNFAPRVFKTYLIGAGSQFYPPNDSIAFVMDLTLP